MAHQEILSQAFEDTYGVPIEQATNEAALGLIGDAIEESQDAYGVPTEDLERPYGMPNEDHQDTYGVLTSSASYNPSYGMNMGSQWGAPGADQGNYNGGATNGYGNGFQGVSNYGAYGGPGNQDYDYTPEDLEAPDGMPMEGLEEPYGAPIGETSKEINDKAKVKLTSVTVLADIHYPLCQPFFLVKEYLNLDFEIIHIDSDHSTHLAKGNPIVRSGSRYPKSFDDMQFSGINISMRVPVLINEAVHPNGVPTVLTESHLICNYLVTIGPVPGGLLLANMLVPPENSEEKATYDMLMNWQMTIFSPRAAPVVEKLGILRRDTSRKRIASNDHEFYNRDYPLLESALKDMDKFLIGNRKKNGPVPGFLCSEFTLIDILFVPDMNELTKYSLHDVRQIRPILADWWQNVVGHLTSRNIGMGPIAFSEDPIS